MTKEEAEQLISNYLVQYGEVQLIKEVTEEYDFGWVFYYQSKMYLESGDENEFLCGNAPCIVDRKSGEIFETGTAYPIEDYIKAYRACGDPEGEPTSSVAILSFSNQKKTGKAIQLLHESCQISLPHARLIMEEVLTGAKRTINALERERAAKLESALNDLGFHAQQVYEKMEMQSRADVDSDIVILPEDIEDWLDEE